MPARPARDAAVRPRHPQHRARLPAAGRADAWRAAERRFPIPANGRCVRHDGRRRTPAPQMAGAIILDGYSRAFAADLATALDRAPREEPLGQALQRQSATPPRCGRAESPSRSPSTARQSGQPWVGMAQLGLTYEDARQARILSGLMLSRLDREDRGRDGHLGKRQDASAAARRQARRMPSWSPAIR